MDAEKDQNSLDASAIASKLLDAPSPGLKRKGSMTRRKSLLLTLNMDDDKSSGEESLSGSSINLHRGNHRSPSRNSRKGILNFSYISNFEGN